MQSGFTKRFEDEMEELPPGVTENDLTFQKLLITAYLDKWQTGTADDAVWQTVLDAGEEVAKDPILAFKHLLQFAELTAGLLQATFENPIEALSGLRTYSGTIEEPDA